MIFWSHANIIRNRFEGNCPNVDKYFAKEVEATMKDSAKRKGGTSTDSDLGIWLRLPFRNISTWADLTHGKVSERRCDPVADDQGPVSWIAVGKMDIQWGRWL